MGNIVKTTITFKSDDGNEYERVISGENKEHLDWYLYRKNKTIRCRWSTNLDYDGPIDEFHHKWFFKDYEGVNYPFNNIGIDETPKIEIEYQKYIRENKLERIVNE